MSAYAKEKGLNDGKNINMDDALKDLLNPPEGVKISIMNIQRYINHHYVSPNPTQTQAEETPASSAKKGKPKVKA
jgi:hypothetical protein